MSIAASSAVATSAVASSAASPPLLEKSIKWKEKYRLTSSPGKSIKWKEKYPNEWKREASILYRNNWVLTRAFRCLGELLDINIQCINFVRVTFGDGFVQQ